MSFELTFDSKSSAALAVCVLLLCALIAAAGFLLGAHHAQLAAVPSHLTAPALPKLPKKPALASSSAASPSQQGSAASGAAAQPQSQSAATAQQPNSNSAPDTYELQFGVFAEQAHAAALVKELKEKSIPSSVSVLQSRTGASYYVVRSGAYPTLQSAADAARAIRAQAGETVFVRHRGSL
jgi:septal ring-binding cell division protein DamX